MAHGFKHTYALRLDDIIAFPDAAHSPVNPPEPGESWQFLAEIIADQSLLRRPVFSVRTQDRVPFMLAWYTDDPAADAQRKRCNVGSVIAIRNANVHHFLDGSRGFRIEDPGTVQTLPCTMARLREIDRRLRQRNDDGLLRASCDVCDATSSLRCSACTTPYCSQEHQKRAWTGGHKTDCKVIATLHAWNCTDWDPLTKENAREARYLSGELIERADIDLVIARTGRRKGEVIEALRTCNGDIISTIMILAAIEPVPAP